MRKLLAPLACFLAATSFFAHGEATRRYAVVSLIGDSMQVFERDPNTAAERRDVQQVVPMADRVFDDDALLAVDRAIKRIDPQAKPMLVSGREPRLFEVQARILDEGGSPTRLVPTIRMILSDKQATHLVLVMKLRAEGMLETDIGHFGAGTIEGLGFFVDRSKPLMRADTGDIGVGFLAPYAYFQLVLIDLSRNQVLKTQRVTASKTISAARSEKGDPWATLTGAAKITVLAELIEREIGKAVPALLGSF